MFKRSSMTKKIAVGMLACFAVGSFSPAQAITWKEVRQLTNEYGKHITAVLLGVALVAGGCIPFSKNNTNFVEKTFGVLAGITGVAFSTISFKQLRKDLEKLRKKDEPNKVEKIVDTNRFFDPFVPFNPPQDERGKYF